MILYFKTDNSHNFVSYLHSCRENSIFQVRKTKNGAARTFRKEVQEFKNDDQIYFSAIPQLPKIIIHISHYISMNNFKQNMWQNRSRIKVETDNRNCFACISAHYSYIFQNYC